MSWNVAMASIKAVLMRRRASGSRSRSGGTAKRATEPWRRSMTKKVAPITLASSHSR